VSDIGIFSTTDLAILAAIALGGLIWPVLIVAMAVGKLGRYQAFLAILLSALVYWLAAFPLDLLSAASIWPLAMVWLTAPVAIVLGLRRLKRRDKGA
jgi:hypothetical protein